MERLDHHEDPRFRRLVTAARDEAPDAALASRTLLALGVGAAATATLAATSHAASVPLAGGAASAGKLAPIVIAKWVGAGFAVGVLTVGAAQVSVSALAPTDAPPAVGASETPSLTIDRPNSSARSSHEEATTIPSSQEELPVAPTRRAVSSFNALQESDLARETRMVERARQLLRAGNPRAAAVVLDQHAAEFPTSRLAAEVAFLRSEIASAAGTAASVP